MDHRNDHVALIVLVAVLAGASGGATVAVPGGSGEGVLQVHLPRAATVGDHQLRLGQISVVRGSGALVAKAAKIGLGRLSVPGQRVVLDRPTILSRLASSGISVQQVRLTGAKAVTVRRQQKIIQADDFIAVGRAFLQKFPQAHQACEIVPVVRPQVLALAELPEDIQLTPELVSGGPRGLAVVRVRVTVEGQDAGTRDISFRLRYKRRKIVAARQIAEGEALSPENVKIETQLSDQPEPAGWKPPYGAVAVRTLAANSEIRRSMIGVAKSTVVVRRNETVQIRIERSGILVTAMGTALQEAHVGESLKVRNVDSRRVIICKVKPDGTVEPML